MRLDFSAAYFAERNLNGGGFQSEGAAEGDVGGIPPRPSVPPKRSGGGLVPFKMVSRKV